MIVLLDNGHGGLINGAYQTPGKRKDWNDKGIIYEGEFNRAIVNGIIEQLTFLKIPYVNIAPEYWDVSLKTRVNRANKYSASKSVYISIHSNAGGGTGSEIFTSVKPTKSDAIATIFGEEYQKEFPDINLRTDFDSDGDLDKEVNFYVLKHTKMPAILTENFFMDNEDEFRTILNVREGRKRIIDYHVQAILRTRIEIFKETSPLNFIP
ncbi:N-acetylmuramoyl-L-alanine amidase [Psychroserpens mesophilus]|uniref:N-acetylmuramoyl-L-alanine amidase n=1 Tax=Psychroserpens mesophilus TaxID=325473 RepID=UPI00058DAB9A|nr:N-acetylmuramoyl-L-alanine amidase [Psychroserpens mesophilus]